MNKLIIAYFTTLVYFLLADFLWLSTMTERLYKPQIGHLFAEKPNLVPAVVFYLIFVLGLLVFVILPSLSQNHSIGKSVLLAALFGAVTYATYDLTNQATLKDWPLLITVVDIFWGATLSALVTILSLLTIKWIL